MNLIINQSHCKKYKHQKEHINSNSTIFYWIYTYFKYFIRLPKPTKIASKNVSYLKY